MSSVSALTASTCALNSVVCCLYSNGTFVMPEWLAAILILSFILALVSLPFRVFRILVGSKEVSGDER